MIARQGFIQETLIIPLGVTKVTVSKVECADDCLKLNESGSINVLYLHLRVESEAHYQEQLCYMAVKIFADFMNEVMSDTQEKKYLTKKSNKKLGNGFRS